MTTYLSAKPGKNHAVLTRQYTYCHFCRYFMQKDGLIKLPPPQNNFFQNHIIKHTSRTDAQQEINSSVDLIGDIRLELVTRNTTSLWNEYIDRYHYLRFTKLPGSQLRY